MKEPDEAAAKCILELANIYTHSTSGSEMFEVYTNRLKTTMATLEEDINIDEEVKIVEENFNSLVVRGSRVHSKSFRFLLF